MYPKSVPGIAVAAWREGRFDLVIPLAQLEEIGRVLAYPKIRRILRWDDEKIGSFLKHLYLRAEIVEAAATRAQVRDAGGVRATPVRWIICGGLAPRSPGAGRRRARARRRPAPGLRGASPPHLIHLTGVARTPPASRTCARVAAASTISARR